MKKADKTTTNEALQKRQKMFSEAEKLANIGIFEWDIRANQVSWSDGLYHIYGLKPDEFEASFEGFLERIHAPHRERVRQTIETAYREGKPFEMEELIVRPNGEKRVLFTRGEVIQDADSQPIRLIGVCQDVTERKKAERARLKSVKLKAEKSQLEKLLKELKETQTQLIQSEKMAALGKLTAGIVHEINTPVGALKSTMDTMSRCSAKINQILENSSTLAEVKNNGDYQKSLKILKENRQVASSASERIIKVVTSLKNFTRLDEAEFEMADIHEGLDSALTLIQHEIKDRVLVEQNYSDIPEIRCYPAELNQVFMTLLRNAAQAIEKKGTITIKTSSDENNVYVKISDTGKGMPSEKIKSLFELGFTTKDTRVGMGMGLINAYNIIQNHKGELKVESEVGKGCTFTIILPMDLKKTIKTV